MIGLNEDVVRCHACPLCEGKEVIAPVAGEGPLDCLFLIIGRNPGALENQSGRPFIGPAGQRLDEMLKQLRVARDTCYVTNAVKCYTIGNAPPPTPLLYQCAELHLAKELMAVTSKVTLIMGKEAQRTFLHLFTEETIALGLDEDPVLSEGLGDRTFFHKKAHVVFMVHPSAALRSPEFNARLLKQTRSLKRYLKKWGLQ